MIIDMRIVILLRVHHMETTLLTLKEPGFLDPSHSWGADSAPPKISETD